MLPLLIDKIWLKFYTLLPIPVFFLPFFVCETKKLCLCWVCVFPVKKWNLTWPCGLYCIYVDDYQHVIFPRYTGVELIGTLQSIYNGLSWNWDCLRLNLRIIPTKFGVISLHKYHSTKNGTTHTKSCLDKDIFWYFVFFRHQQAKLFFTLRITQNVLT